MNRLQRIFAVPQAERDRLAPPAAGGEAPATGTNVFITPESFASFPVMTGAIWAIVAVLKKADVVHNDVLAVLYVSLAVGVVLFLVGINTPGTKPPIYVALPVAVVNSFLLAAAVMGLTQGQSTKNPDTEPQKPKTTVSAPAPAAAVPANSATNPPVTSSPVPHTERIGGRPPNDSA